ncbi:MAG: polysaccharide biosynthesis C-terminal domain-containing protein, partial [Lachnospiraceae bacterium]|nr:polysaccharide biosynthesis C-terminal domain-containing protein [Lachnospiraceae bacterium]
MKKLTEGKPIKVILIFMLPLLVGQIFQLLYNLVDTRIVGQILGEDALAAVASTTSLSDLLITLIYGLTNGFAIITASFFGAKDEKNLKKSIAGTFTLGVAISVILSVFCLIFIDPLLRLIKVDEKLYTDAKSYILIILAGLVVTALYNICACTLRSIGDSVTPLIFLIISALLNIVLDYVFIKFLHLGVAGAALATVISQIVSVILCFIYISRKY